jgi:hypothetical protein
MTSRERFEQDLQARNPTWLPDHLFSRANSGAYASLVTEKCWQSWQAAERDMLARCIAVFDQPYVAHDGAEIVNKLKELVK